MISSSNAQGRGLQRDIRVPGGVPWVYLAPTLITLGIWIYWPLGRAAWLSFYQWNMLPSSPRQFVGWSNYVELLAVPDLWQAVRNTGIYVLGLLPIAVLLPLSVALLAQSLGRRASSIYQALIFVPMIIPPVVAAVTWRWLLDPDHGIVNALVRAAGFDAIAFLSNRHIAIWTIIVITGWKLMGFSTLILAAANDGIDRSLIEAATIDGAGPWRVIRDIRLPLLLPSVTLLTIMTVLFGAQWSFSTINVLKEGGPVGATTNIFYLLWTFGFSSMSVGWSSAAAMILFVSLGSIAFLLFRLLDRGSP